MDKKRIGRILLCAAALLAALIAGFVIYGAAGNPRTRQRFRLDQTKIPQGTEKITGYFRNDSFAEATCGAAFSLDREENGVWTEVPYKNGEAFFYLWARSVRRFIGGTPVVYDLEGYYGELTPGTYRINVSVSVKRAGQDWYDVPLSATFEITEK